MTITPELQKAATFFQNNIDTFIDKLELEISTKRKKAHSIDPNSTIYCDRSRLDEYGCIKNTICWNILNNDYDFGFSDRTIKKAIDIITGFEKNPTLDFIKNNPLI